ncbi:MAG TPA: ATP-binding protein [Thermoanaerobaculia bacterium]|jgi:SpoVK/Ycf46/Vps4 family AAA+-type ATPase
MASPLLSIFTGRTTSRAVEIVTPQRTFADVILPPQTRRALDDAIGQVRNHSLIFTRWGLGERHSTGLGLAFNFAGPPGTGKTICAEAIAHSLGMKLLVVDYAEVESMWAGETPKNIVAAFRTAADQRAVLFFDEADAIAGRRSTAGASLPYQREANITVNVLLRELEAFNGVVIFATNLAANFDPAFERRIRAHVRFEMPGADERERIWKVQIHPHKTPLAEDVDFRLLAERFTVSGGDIKNAVIKAAAAAASEPGSERSKQIHQQHFERAMADVQAAKLIMQQSLFREELYDPPWRRPLLLALTLGGSALIAALIALGIALLR